jgi:hypothetical protein
VKGSERYSNNNNNNKSRNWKMREEELILQRATLVGVDWRLWTVLQYSCNNYSIISCCSTGFSNMCCMVLCCGVVLCLVGDYQTTRCKEDTSQVKLTIFQRIDIGRCACNKINSEPHDAIQDNTTTSRPTTTTSTRSNQQTTNKQTTRSKKQKNKENTQKAK